MNSKLILASGSPRRKELLSLYTTDFEIHVSDFDESAVTADTPARLVEKLARGKCLAVAARHPGDLVLGCDTVVDVNGKVFGKPHSVEDATRPQKSPTIRPEPTPFRAGQPSGWTASRAIITPLWASPSAALSGSSSNFDALKMKNCQKT